MINNLLFIAIIFQSVAVVILCLFYFPLMRTIFKRKSDEADFQKKSQEEARKTILSAEDQAQNIISLASQTKNDSETRLNSALENFYVLYNQQLSTQGDKFLAEYSKALESAENKDIIALQKISEGIEITIQKYLSDFSARLNSQTDETIKIVQGEISKELVAAQKEINDYKAERLKLVENQASDLVDKVIRDVVGKSLSPEKQQELVASAIKMAASKQ